MTALSESDRRASESLQDLALAVRAAMWAEDEKFRELFSDR